MKPVVAGLALAVVVLGGVVLMRGGPEGGNEPPPDSAELPAARPAPDVVLAIRPTGARTAPVAAAAKPKLSPLLQELASGKGRKAMYDRLSQSTSRTPEETFVLAELLARCAGPSRRYRQPMTDVASKAARERFLATISPKDPSRDKRIAAYESTMASTCEGFESVTPAAGDIKALYQQAAQAGDPRAQARLIEMEVWEPLTTPDGGISMRDGKMPSLNDDQLARLRAAVASNDPLVLRTAGGLLASTMGDLVIRTGPEERPIDPRAFFNAWNLAACDAGLDCGPANSELVNGCYRLGNCSAADLREYQFFYSNSPQQSQLVADYQSHIVAAIRSGDWSYFQFVRAAPPPGSTYHFGPGP